MSSRVQIRLSTRLVPIQLNESTCLGPAGPSGLIPVIDVEELFRLSRRPVFQRESTGGKGCMHGGDDDAGITPFLWRAHTVGVTTMLAVIISP